MPFLIPILGAIGAAVSSAGAAIGIGTAVAAGTTAAVTIGLTTVLLGVQLITGIVSRALKSSPSASSLAYDSANHAVAVRQAIAPRIFIYGRVSVGGIISYLATTGSNAEYLHLVVTWTGRQCHAIESLWFDDYQLILDGSGNETGTYAGLVSVENKLGAPGEAAFPGLIADTGGMTGAWTSAHRQDGCCSTHFKIKWSATKFPNGVPALRAVIQGSLVYDPRSPGNPPAYSENLALCVRDYLVSDSHPFGLKCLPAEIDDTALAAAANVADESVALALGGSEARYRCDGLVDSSNALGDILQRLLGAGFGKLAWIGGKWSLYLGAWRSSSASYGDDDFRGGLQLTARLSRRDNFNSVKGTFVCEANSWQATSFPARQVAAFIADDSGFTTDTDQGYWTLGIPYVIGDCVLLGGNAFHCIVAHTSTGGNEPGVGASWQTYWVLCTEVAWKDVEYSFVTSQTQAQRLSKIELETARRPITLAAPMKLGAYASQPPDVISLTHAHFGFSSKTFELQGAQFSVGSDLVLGVDFTLKETDSGIFSWVAAFDELPFLGQATPAQSTRPAYYQTVAQNNLPPVGIGNVNSALIGDTSPLTSVDAGSNADIDIAAFQMQFGFGIVSYSGGTIHGLAYGNVYWISLDDPYLTGGAVSYTAWTSPWSAVSDPTRVYVGEIKTATHGSGGTTGQRGGGGSGGFYGL